MWKTAKLKMSCATTQQFLRNI
uniref:Uncharacterized protein n=1 Tax=Anguilla anguilla TaxID=7936 RepID=A0A0E9PSF4_ANGAN